MTEANKALVYLALTGVFWSTGGVLIKWVEWHPMAIAGIRSIIAAVIMWLAFRKDTFVISKQQIGGAIAYCCMLCLFVTSNKLTTAANAILLQYTAPVYVALLGGWLLAERTTRRDWVTILLIFSGIIFFFMDKITPGGMVGNLCAILSGVSYAVFTVFMRLQKGGSPYVTVLLGNLLTFAVSIFYLPEVSFKSTNLAGIILLGVIQLGLPYVLFTRAIRHVKALEATLFTTLEPILSPLWVFIFFGEVPGVYAMIGGLIVIVTLAGRCWYDSVAASPGAECRAEAVRHEA